MSPCCSYPKINVTFPPVFVSHCLVFSVQFNKELLEGRGGDRTEKLGGCWRVLRVGRGPGPALVELDKKVRVFKGPPEDDGLHQVDEGHDHEADEEEGDEGPEVIPGHADPVAQTAKPALLPGVGRVAGGIWDRSATRGLVI